MSSDPPVPPGQPPDDPLPDDPVPIEEPPRPIPVPPSPPPEPLRASSQPMVGPVGLEPTTPRLKVTGLAITLGNILVLYRQSRAIFPLQLAAWWVT